MLNKIIRISLDNRIAVLIITAILLILGTLMLFRMEVDIFPDLNAPTVVIMTEAPGMAPEEVEKTVTYPIETAVNGSTGVRRVRSSSTTGFSVVWVEFNWDTDIYRARQIVSERLDAAAENLPQGVANPVMGPQSSILGEMMIIGLTSDKSSMLELRKIADNIVKPRLLALGGVSQVSVIGGDAPEYRILVNPEMLRIRGVTMNDVVEATQNMTYNAGGGSVYDYGNEYVIKARFNTTDLDELGMTVVRSDDNGIVTLNDIATIDFGPRSPQTGVASVKAHPAVIITVTKQPAAGTIPLTEKIDNELSEISRTLPKDVTISTDIFRQADFISASISNLQESLIEGAVFVLIVLFIFLMNIRTTLISIIVLPLSIIITIIILNILGFTINTMSLGGIAIAIGCLVDDAIVDVENVYKRLRQNRLLPPEEKEPILTTVYNASAEVRTPIFNSTLIIVAAFLPLFFLSGMEGRMLKPLGIAFIVALAASTIVALTLTPVLCSYLLGSKKEAEKLSKEPPLAKWLRNAYEKSLNSTLRHKRILLGGTSLLFIIALVLFFTLGRGFLPGFNEGSFTINVSTLPGISLEESDKIGREAERIILETPEVITVARKTGRAELDEHSLGVNVSEIEAPYHIDKRTRREITADLRKRLSEIPGAVIEIGQPISHRIDAMLSGAQSQIAIKIFGPDLNRLAMLGNKVKEIISEVDGVVDPAMEQQIERPQLLIVPRREMLVAHGITPAAFRDFIETALSGKTVSQVYDGGYSYDLAVILSPESRSSIDDIKDLTVNTPQGGVTLSTLADITSTTGPNTVNRENVERRIIVSANVDGRDLRGTVDDIRNHISREIELPENYHISYGGQFESQESASRTLLLTSFLALIIIFMLLYSEFHNTAQSIIILVNMPLALIGGVLILVITGSELNIPAIIGFISLMGISTRNGMLLISRYNRLKKEGAALENRIMTGSTDRLLPIIMTALTSALALIPLAWNYDSPGNEIQAPMALVILGGLVSSTALNMYVVPVLYYIICKKKNK